jgi:hypothetical protein
MSINVNVSALIYLKDPLKHLLLPSFDQNAAKNANTR